MTDDQVHVHAAATQSFRPESKVPNEETRAALKEAREIRKRRTARFETPNALLADLNDLEILATDRN